MSPTAKDEPRAEPDLLFVYGTLRRGFERYPILRRLGARFLAQGRVRGALYNLGRFPGALAEEPGWVQGEIYRLPDPRRALQALDEVEEFRFRAPETSFFLRDRTDVILEDGRDIEAWIYWLSRRVPAMRRIDSGDYARP